MIHGRAALVAVIAAQWLAIVGGVLMAWWLLLGGNLGILHPVVPAWRWRPARLH